MHGLCKCALVYVGTAATARRISDRNTWRKVCSQSCFSFGMIYDSCSLCFSVCYLKEGPCGGVPSGEPMATLAGGSKYSIHFQQNLNHFYIQQPGKLVADFASNSNPVESDFSELAFIHDYNAVSRLLLFVGCRNGLN